MDEAKERMLEMNDCGEEYKLEQVRFILGSDFDRDHRNTYSRCTLLGHRIQSRLPGFRFLMTIEIQNPNAKVFKEGEGRVIKL